MNKQITIFDIIEQPVKKEPPCGYIDDLLLIGRELQFQELKDMIGKKCIVSSSTASNIGFKVIRIFDYFENSGSVYKRVRELPEGCMRYGEYVNDYIYEKCGQKEAMKCYEKAYTCDKVGYSDNERCKASNSWVSEMYCRNGRHDPINGFAETFYELII